MISPQYFASAGSGGVTPIQDQVLTLSGATITFSAIPQTFRHLLLLTSLRGIGGASTFFFALMRINGDATAVYSDQRLYGIGATATSAEGLSGNAAAAAFETPVTAEANAFAKGAIWIPDYTAAENTTWDATTACTLGNVSGGGAVATLMGTHHAAAAVTSLLLLSSTGGFVAGSRATLYGLS